MAAPDGFKVSSFCHEGGCVAVGSDGEGGVRLTSSAVDGSPILGFSAQEWAAFVAGVRAGEFDLDRMI